HSNIIPVVKQENNTTLKYTMNIRYPQIEGNNLNKFAKQFNQQVSQLVTQQINDFKKNISNQSVVPNMSLNTKNNFNMNYQLASFISESQQTIFISIRFNIDTYELGMAHPAHITSVMNYDLGHSQILSLADLFKPVTPYL